MIEMEDLLFICLEDCNWKQILIDLNDIMIKTLSLLSTIKENSR